jgi:hypothetical protein
MVRPRLTLHRRRLTGEASQGVIVLNRSPALLLLRLAGVPDGLRPSGITTPRWFKPSETRAASLTLAASVGLQLPTVNRSQSGITKINYTVVCHCIIRKARPGRNEMTSPVGHSARPIARSSVTKTQNGSNVKNRVVLGDSQQRAVFRLGWDGQAKSWLLSEYRLEKETPSIAGKRTGVVSTLKGAGETLFPTGSKSTSPTQESKVKSPLANLSAEKQARAEEINRQLRERSGKSKDQQRDEGTADIAGPPAGEQGGRLRSSGAAAVRFRSLERVRTDFQGLGATVAEIGPEEEAVRRQGLWVDYRMSESQKKLIPAPEWMKRRMSAVRSLSHATPSEMERQLKASAEHRRKLSCSQTMLEQSVTNLKKGIASAPVDWTPFLKR